MSELKTAKDLGMRYTRIMDWLRSANPNADMPVWLNPQKEAELIERIDAAEAKVESLIADLAQARAELARMREPVSDQEWKHWSHEVVIPSRDFDPDYRFHVLNRRNADNLIAARASTGGDNGK